MKPKTLLLIIVLALIAGAIYYLESAKPNIPKSGLENTGKISQELAQSDGTRQPEGSLAAEEKERISKKEAIYQRSPELSGIAGYLNAEEGTKISDFRGKVVLVDFWTYTCINCIRTLPHLVEWDRKYRDKGLVIIGVHTPEFEFEKAYENVKMAIDKYGIEYRVVQDNDYQTWRAFKNRFWPRKYLIDADGFIRYDHIGEGGYQETEKKIQELLMERGVRLDDMPLSEVEDKTPRAQLTPELYAGYLFALPRGQDVGNAEGMQMEKETAYTLPDEIQENILYLNRTWKSNPDNLEAKEDGASITLRFTASQANIVTEKPSQPIRLFVSINGKPVSKEQAGSDVVFENGKSYAFITEPRLYNVVDGEYGTYTLTLAAEKKGFAFNAFTFG